MTVIYAVEAWILAIMGWGWLVFQDMWGPSLLCTHAFYAMLGLSTGNLVLVSLRPDSRIPRAAYFAAVLVLFLHAGGCVADALYAPSIGWTKFRSPTENPACTLARTQQLFWFSSSPLFPVQAGALLGYLAVQLVVGGAGLLDSGVGTLWPGAAWGLGLGMLLACRLFVLFDGTAQGLAGRRHVRLFSLPIVEIATVLAGLMYAQGLFLGMEGFVFKGVSWRRSARYVGFVFSAFFVGFGLWAPLAHGLLTPGMLVLLAIIAAVSVGGLAAAAMAPADPVEEAPPRTSARWRPDALVQPTAPPASVVFGRPPRPSAPTMYARPSGYIPSPVEMAGLAARKNKAV